MSENEKKDGLQSLPSPSPMTAQKKLELSLKRRLAIKRIEQLSGNALWSLLEQIIHDVEAYYVLKDIKLTTDEIISGTREEIDARYANDPEQEEVYELLKDAVPSKNTLLLWKKKRGWEEAVWAKARACFRKTEEPR
jgi:hypothetical protein